METVKRSTKLESLTIVIPAHHADSRLQRAITSSLWAKVLLIEQSTQPILKTLCTQFKLDCIKYPNLSSFSDMRNLALEEVKTPWVFFLDSDEWITPELQKDIQRKISLLEYVAYRVRRIDVFRENRLVHGELANQWHVRLAKTDDCYWSGAVHEKLCVKVGRISDMNEVLLHEPHTSTTSFLTKVNEYTDILSREKEPHTAMWSVLWPVGKFICSYILRFGWLDGMPGLIYSVCMSIHSASVRIKRYERALAKPNRS